MSRPRLNEPQFMHLFTWERVCFTHTKIIIFFLSLDEIWIFKFHISSISTWGFFVCVVVGFF